MGFWTEIKKELQLSKFGFRGVQIDRFCHFQWRLPVALYIGYRLVLMLYGAFWLGYISTYHGTPPQSWGAYLTNWTYIMLNIYLISHCLLALVLHARRLICSCPAGRRARYCCGKQSMESYEAMFLEFGRNEDGYDIIPGSAATTVGAGDREDFNGVENSAVTLCENVEPGYRQRQTLPIYACFAWVMYSVISAAAMMVTIVFFSFLFPLLSDYPEIGLENLQVHLLNSVIILVEHCLSAVPCRLLHAIYPLLYGLIYMTFSLIYWTGDHERVLYPDILDWNKPGSTVGYVILIGFVFIPLLHTFFFVLYKIKLQIFKHFYFGQS